MALADRLRSLFVREPIAYRPAEGLPFVIPVLLVHYFPAAGDQLDGRVTGDVHGALATIRGHCRQTTARVIQVLQEGSRYHGYGDAAAPPSLRYEVVGSLEFLEPLPTWRKPGHQVPMTDYNAVMDRIDARTWVMERGVKEIWTWGYHGGMVDLWESNMAGPFGDVSNSDCDERDLPVFDRTYTVYHYNYGRGASEAVENHMHQLERLLNHVDRELFWERFVGETGEGRCGWSHIPPNGERDYDWANRRAVESDIEDWRPDGSGRRARISSARWGGDSLRWFVYWMQNLPGADNGLDDRGRPLTNWWTFAGDWDGAMAARLGLKE